MDKSKLERLILVLAEQQRFRPEIVEKDYYLTVVLNSIAKLSQNLVFKGGTLLNKIHLNYHRLSEDLDFSYFGGEDLNTRPKRSKAIASIKEKMPDFLAHLDLESDQPRGAGFNESLQYVFNAFYPSFITGKDENIKIEISLRQRPMDQPVYNVINHFFQDPFTGEDLISRNKIWSLSFDEAVAEKLKCAISRRDIAIRDFYDLWHIAKTKFDFHGEHFLFLFMKKLETEGYKGNFRNNFGLDDKAIDMLKAQVETDLIPVIRSGELFNLGKVFALFNRILKKI
ncbi:MAG: nucleotidyl transferase AbiEii/AbiGii toxin family protein [Candidatus Margulisbacteria bacterium]|nr:nucleotidyl transferase AbiEii/AbiGii toxin family protein [Candidatus Margulisiibacteriota bacterium]